MTRVMGAGDSFIKGNGAFGGGCLEMPVTGYRQYAEANPGVDVTTLPEIHNFGSSGINAKLVEENFAAMAEVASLGGEEPLVFVLSLGANAARIEQDGIQNTPYGKFIDEVAQIIEAAKEYTKDRTAGHVGILEIPSMDDTKTNGPRGWNNTGIRFPDAEMRSYANGLDILCDQLGAVYIGGVRRALALAKSHPDLSPVSSDHLHPGLGAIPMALLVERFLNGAVGFDPGPEGTVLGPIHPLFRDPAFRDAVLLG